MSGVMPGQSLADVLGGQVSVLGSMGGVTKLVADTAAGALQAGMTVKIPALAEPSAGIGSGFAVAESGMQSRGADVFPAGQPLPAPEIKPQDAQPTIRPQGVDMG